MKIGDKFIYTAVASDWKFGRECEIVGEIGGCWIIKTVGYPNHKSICINKGLFPMKAMSIEEIAEKKKKSTAIAKIK